MVSQRNVFWRSISPVRRRTTGVAFDVPRPPHILEKGLERSLEIAGIPAAAPSVSPEEEALMLLEIAAELEHALLIEYLYAAFSCETVSLRNNLLLIARQEMGHLITVQNLRLLLGGVPYLGRQDQSPQPENDPFLFRLEPVSLEVLAKYCVCEMPAESQVPSGLKPLVEEIRQRAAAVVGDAIHRVGALYAKIYWLFMADDHNVGPWVDFPANIFASIEPGRHVHTFPGSAHTSLQADSAEWEIGGDDIYVDLCANRDQALDALQRIAAQGEGLSTETESHFELFVTAYEQFKSGAVRVHPVPINPTTASDCPGTPLSNPVASGLAKLLDASYELLILEILLSLSIDKNSDQVELRTALIHETLVDMRVCIRRIANHLASKIPLAAGQPLGAVPRAGATFTAPAITTGTRTELTRRWGDAITRFQVQIAAVDSLQALDTVARSWLAGFRSQAQAKQELAEQLAAS
jgi:hypothetical protein